MALRFSFFDRVLGISPQVVGCRLLSPFIRMVEFTNSQLGQYYSLARLMSSLSASVRRTALSARRFLDVSPFNTTGRE